MFISFWEKLEKFAIYVMFLLFQQNISYLGPGTLSNEKI